MNDQPVFNDVPSEKLVILGVEMQVLLTKSQTGGRFSAVEGIMLPGGDGGLHIHHREDESMIILEGSLTVTIAGETRFLSAGDSYFVPRGVSHRIRNEGPVPMRSCRLPRPENLRISSWLPASSVLISTSSIHRHRRHWNI